MASTVRNTSLQIGILEIPVAVKKLSDRSDVTFGRATAKGEKIKRADVVATPAPVASTQAEPTDRVGALPEGWAEQVAVPEAVEGAAEVAARALVADEVHRGVWVGEHFYPIDEAELDRIKEETTLPNLNVLGFVPVTRVPLERSTGCYFLAPPKGYAPDALKTLMAAMRRTRKAAVLKWCPSTRQALAVLIARGDALLMVNMTFANDFAQVAEASVALGKVKPSQRAVETAGMLIEAMSVPVSIIDEQVDEAVALKEQLRDAAVAGKPFATPKASRVAGVVAQTESEILGALEESLRQAGVDVPA